MKILLVVVLLLHGPFWSFHVIGVDARAEDPAVSPGTLSPETFFGLSNYVYQCV